MSAELDGIIGLVLCGIGALLFRYARRSQASYRRAGGRVVGLRTDGMAEVAFTAPDGSEHRFSANLYDKNDENPIRVGSKIKVAYDPAHPESATANAAATTPNILAFVCLAAGLRMLVLAIGW